MVPDLDRAAREADDQVKSFHLYNNATSRSACDQRNFAAATIITDHLPPQDIDLRPSSRGLTTSCAFCPPLKAIPLAAFYKLHRLPQVITMPEPEANGYADISLPSHTSLPLPSADGPERSPQNGVHNKLLEQAIRTPDRQPSPQPMHLNVPGASQHRILQEEGPGYVAPKFEGKELQMDQGGFQDLHPQGLVPTAHG